MCEVKTKGLSIFWGTNNGIPSPYVSVPLFFTRFLVLHSTLHSFTPERQPQTQFTRFFVQLRPVLQSLQFKSLLVELQPPKEEKRSKYLKNNNASSANEESDH